MEEVTEPIVDDIYYYFFLYSMHEHMHAKT